MEEEEEEERERSWRRESRRRSCNGVVVVALIFWLFFFFFFGKEFCWEIDGEEGNYSQGSCWMRPIIFPVSPNFLVGPSML